MKNWKISKIQIQGFKAFSAAKFDLAATTLVTLEGPNGYGKTSVFDALELLLTGRINRLCRLVATVMHQKKINYDDNLYWNTKKDKNTLFIKAEFLNIDTQELRAFARFATPRQLSQPSNNRADKFEIFNLCELENFDSSDFSSNLPTDYFDNFFGVNFSKNYSMLNYLHQGESSFIFGSSTVERKNAIESLIDSKAVTEKIEFLNKVERKLTNLLNANSDETEIARLTQKIKDLSSISETGEALTYSGISTKTPPPDWDAKDPFPEVDSQRYLYLIGKVEKLLACSLPAVQEEIRVRLRNRQIESYIERNSDLFTIAVAIGKHIDKYETLRATELRLTNIQHIFNRIKKDAKEFQKEDIEFVSAKGLDVDEVIKTTVEARDQLTAKVKQLDVALVAVVAAREALLNAHENIQHKEDSCCPMCGHDWQTKENMKHAVDITGYALKKGMDVLTEELLDSNTKLNDLLAPIRTELTTERRKLEQDFDRPLLTKLESSQESFENIRKLNLKLEERSIFYESEFSTDLTELEVRKASIIQQMRALKTVEGEDPPDKWYELIYESFYKIEDFYSLDTAQIVSKREYLAYAHRLLQNSDLQNSVKQLAEKNALKESRKIAKNRVSALKKVLTDTERRYSGGTIADIELIFHIYSGRLIQNYQRGLGLFIERGEGNRLQFSTAERSEHDATLSMSSGQLSALSMAFFLALNRVYSKTPFVLIDDPAQSLDDINVASLTDLLRCELRDRQLIMSSHEDDIAAYMRYRFERANLSQKAFHMQSHLQE